MLMIVGLVGRASNGSIVPDLTDYVHSIGLKFGIYSDAGEKTFYGRPGSLNHEISDANSYAKWGVDYLKYDNYNNLLFTRYAVMRDALNKTGHPIFYSISNFGKIDSVPNVANSWRTSRDEIDFWDTMVSKADANNEWWRLAKPGAWNDPGMLEVGIAEMSNTEYEAHFSLWALMKAPLIIGCEISNMFDEIFRIITNPEVIAVNQDKLGAQGFKFKLDGDKELWGCPLDDGAVAALFLNRGNETATFKIQWSDLFLENNVTTAAVRDLWGHQNLGTFDGTLYAVAPSHGVAMFRITPVN